MSENLQKVREGHVNVRQVLETVAVSVGVVMQIMDHGPAVTWDDIAGLEFVKKTVKEIVIWPMLRPYVFPLSPKP